MREQFEKELRTVKQEFMEMAGLVDKLFDFTCHAFLENASVEIKEVADIELLVNDYKRRIENKSMLILLQQQPVASDFSLLSSLLLMVGELYHGANQLRDICELIQDSEPETQYHNMEMLKSMLAITKDMMAEAVSSFALQDKDMANLVINKDDEVDLLFATFKIECINYLKNGEYPPDMVINALMIAKHLEKIGDYAVSLAYWHRT